MKLNGKIAFKDVETGVWVLEGDDGKTYQLAGGDRKMLKEGARVEADGEVDNDTLGIAMVGPRFVVKTYKLR